MRTPRHTFPIARRLWRVGMRAAAAWRDRHRHPVNYALHLIGIPLALAGAALLLLLPWHLPLWSWAAGLFGLGYFLQWAGHRVEGNDVGEFIPVKRALGLPVVSVVPRPRTDPHVSASGASPHPPLSPPPPPA